MYDVITKLSDTGWERFARRKRKMFRVFPRDSMGKGSRLFTAGWEWDGKVGSHLVDGTGQDGATRFHGGTGRDGTGSGNGSGI